MPGNRPANFRKGDLAEGLGLELLRPFAFVAPVPRPEDVGVDAVATLFRPDGIRLIAEDSFLIQVKTATTRQIEYRGAELEWLRALKLPFFWLSLNLTTLTAELWSLTSVSSHPNFRDRKAVTAYLDPRPFDISGGEMHRYLEKPILRWTPVEAVDEAFQQNAYRVLKAWIAFEMQCLAVRPLGMTLDMAWETNCAPNPTGGHAFMHHPDELRAKLQQALPYVEMLSSLCWRGSVAEPSDGSDKLLFAMVLLSDYMRQHDIDPDPYRMLNIFAQERLQRQVAQSRSNPPEAG